ncbi:Kinesin light chain [Hondaea fermentalgiana]|uniref:Kinesin light chain n=1 Tax=Hondaea fermentalgiana TaxID=2315210 RepID=A0A2R5G1T8_9STRA|nr:Kinesin light chain [Hondaea fermentalgiana]|eukprot:GBG24987.1 Kinesin light chain [Hondaea fermentalgiana]
MWRTRSTPSPVYNAQVRNEEALSYFKEALSIYRESLGDRHPLVAATLNNIADVYYRQGRCEEALAYYEALSIYRESLGDWHFSVAATLHNIASVYDSQSRDEEALPYYEEALSIKKESLGDRHPIVVTLVHFCHRSLLQLRNDGLGIGMHSDNSCVNAKVFQKVPNA